MKRRTLRIAISMVIPSILISCISEPVEGENQTIVRAKGGTSLKDVPPEQAAQVLAMAFGPRNSPVRKPVPVQEEVREDPLDILPEEVIDGLDFPKTDLGTALRMLAEASNVNLVLTESLNDTVEMSFQGITLRQAVRSLVRRFGLHVERDGNVLVIGSKPEDELVGRMFMTHSVNASDLQETVLSLLSENGQLTTSPSGNALFVRDSADHIQQIEEFLTAVDTREAQVCIEVRIMEVGFQEGFELGFFLRDSNINFGGATGEIIQNLLTPQTDVVASVINDSGTLEGVVDALETIATLDLLSMPSVTVLSGRQATIEVITRIPYVQATASIATDGGATTTSTETIEFEEVGITLNVTPVVQHDDHVRLTVEPEVSEAVDFFQGVPVVDRRKVKTEVLVADNGTVFLGGLFRDNVFHSVDKVPLLGDIPYLGKIFRRTVDRHVKSELVIQITPRVIVGGEIVNDEGRQQRFDDLKEETAEKSR